MQVHTSCRASKTVDVDKSFRIHILPWGRRVHLLPNSACQCASASSSVGSQDPVFTCRPLMLSGMPMSMHSLTDGCCFADRWRYG